MKVCSKCKVEKTAAEFSSHAGHGDGLGSACKTCTNAASRTWRAANPDKTRNYKLRFSFDISLGDYLALLATQGGCCAICRVDSPGGRGAFHVDHDHETGKVRGLLCHNCNLGIGHLNDDPMMLVRAAEYLWVHESATQ